MVNEIILAIEKIIKNKGSCIVALDGRCGSGKTTLAKRLEDCFECNVFHMDDFFLPFEKRDAGRLGNVDCERFREEVLNPIKMKKDFSYRPFSCKIGSLLNPVEVRCKAVTVIEGSYSCQPQLFEYYDLHVFVDTDKEVQQARIEEREGREKLKAFNEKWIPMEERYFSCTDIKYKCEIYYKT